MTPTEQRYSQIEKEALATTWSLERFNDYLYGMSFHVETDHKPLVSLLSSKKNLDELSPRIQRFRMRLMRYMYTIAHVPGKSLVTADALSRAPQERPLTEAEELLTDEVRHKQTWLWVRYLQQRSVWPRSELDNSKTTCVDRLCATVQRVGQATHPCHRCRGRTASTKRVDNPERVTP